MEQVWGTDFCGESRTVDMHIRTPAAEAGAGGYTHPDRPQCGLSLGGYRMTKRIFRSTLAVGLAVLLASLAVVMGCLYDYYVRLQEYQLRDELSLAAAAVEEQGADYLSKLESDRYRITWLRSDGTVLYDTEGRCRQHGEPRPAAGGAAGADHRRGREQPLQCHAAGENTVLRPATAGRHGAAIVGHPRHLGRAAAVHAPAAAAGAGGGADPVRRAGRAGVPPHRRAAEPAGSGAPLDNDAYEELSPLLRRLEHQRRQIDDQLRDLRRQAEKFQQITANMNEGLVLLDEDGAVLSLNPAACRIFKTDDTCVGRDFLTVERDSRRQPRPP